MKAKLQGRKFTDIVRAEIEAAYEAAANQLSLELYTNDRPPRHVKIFADGAPNAEDTWVGICTLCEARHVTNLDPKKHMIMPLPCGEVAGRDGAVCSGNVLLSPESDALLAAFKIGGWDALRDASGCGTVLRYELQGLTEFIPGSEVEINTQHPLPGGGSVRTMERRRK